MPEHTGLFVGVRADDGQCERMFRLVADQGRQQSVGAFHSKGRVPCSTQGLIPLNIGSIDMIWMKIRTCRCFLYVLLFLFFIDEEMRHVPSAFQKNARKREKFA